MILVQRAARPILFRRYGTLALQQRITTFLKFIKHLDSPHELPWSSVIRLGTFDSAVAQLEFIADSSTPPQDHALFPSSSNAALTPPTWLLIRMCSKVRSPADAEKASHLIITNLPYVPPDLRPPVLILVVHILSTYRVLPALDPVIKLFIGLPIFHEYWHFNSLLEALILYANSATDGRYLGGLAVLLLKTMTERELSLTMKTYRALLQSRYVTMELTEELRQRMIRDKIVPDRVLLESLLRISARHGSVKDAATYTHAIHHLDEKDEFSLMSTSQQSRPPESETNQIVPSTTVQYLTHLVHENYLRKQFDADAEWSRFMKTGRSRRFLNKQNSSATAWAARLFSLSSTRSFSPENLVAFFDWSHAQRFPFHTHTAISYTIVLRGLLLKSAYALALEVWERFLRHRTHNLRLDMVTLGVGVEVLTRAGHPDRALALIDSPANELRRVRSASIPLFHTVRRSRVPMSLVNRFMRVLKTTNPSAALQLWEYMGILYDATPDALSFTIMLGAARRATLNGESFAGAMQELGFDLRFRLPFAKPDWARVLGLGSEIESTSVGAESLDRARRRSYKNFEKSLTVNEGDMWGGERAWRRAHRIFTSALLAGWPELANVRAPARAIRSSIESSATAPLRDLKNFLEPPSHDAAPNGNNDLEDGFPLHDEPSYLHSVPLLPIHPRGAYPSFAPNDATFRASVLLLGTARCARQIPLILAWMRALGITPRTRTLAYALVYWAEVSMGSPLLERLQRHLREDGGEYVRLVRWMEDWVGAENVPDEAAIGDAMREVDAVRRGRRHGR